MILKHFGKVFFTAFVFIFCACGNADTGNVSGGAEAVTSDINTAVPPEAAAHFELKTYEVTDTIQRKKSGWGYDIYKDGKRMIHQPIIPAIPGNNSFPSEEKARAVGMFAIEKMKKTGSLPTLTVAELDSLGIK